MMLSKKVIENKLRHNYNHHQQQRGNIMYYIIETIYTGPNQDQYVDADRIEITTTPAIGNCSREVCIDGWCGTTDDWAVYAHGEYETLEEARDAIIETFGVVRDSDPNGDRFESFDENVVEAYKPNKYAPLSSWATADWSYERIRSDIDAYTTDERIAELVAEYEEEANRHGYTLDSDLDYFMQERRQELLSQKKDRQAIRNAAAIALKRT